MHNNQFEISSYKALFFSHGKLFLHSILEIEYYRYGFGCFIKKKNIVTTSSMSVRVKEHNLANHILVSKKPR